jgi:polyisoprenoid-binding protein YceI
MPSNGRKEETMRSLRMIAAVVAVMAATSAGAEVRPAERKVTFALRGPGRLDVRGGTDSLELQREPGHLGLKVALATLRTGVPSRDKVMREQHLEVQKYPAALLTVPLAAIRRPGAGVEITTQTKGSMTLHGRTRDVNVHYTVKRTTANKYAVRSTSRIDMRDFGIAVPTWQGTALQPEVDLTIAFETTENELR